MTIDEAISDEKEKAKEQKTKYDKCHTRMKYCCEMCFHNPKCNEVAEYHEQLAEWLELLKWYEQGMEDIPCESGVLPKDVYHAGYHKALNDFVKFASDMPTVEEEDGAIRPMWLEEMAEQLKAGGKNETDNT